MDSRPSKNLLLGAIGVALAAALVAGLVFRVIESKRKAAALEAEAREKSARALARAAQPAGAELAETKTANELAVVKTGRHIPFSGELRPVNEAELAFKVGGRLQRILVKTGEWVKEGQPLLQLDDREAEAQLKQAKAALNAARAQAAIAEDAERRVGKLGAGGAVTPQQQVQAVNQAALAGAGVDQAKAQAELAELNVSNHILRAPFSGRVTRVPPGTGAIVAPGVPLLGVVDTSRWRVYGSTSVEQGAALTPGMAVKFALVGLAQGVVAQLSPVLQERSRRVQFEIVAAADADAPLFVGQLVSGYVIVDHQSAENGEKPKRRAKSVGR